MFIKGITKGPKDKDGNYMPLLLQVNLKNVDLVNFPKKGILEIFTDKEGEFVFGPLCPGKEYAIQIWVDDVKHVKVCEKTFHEGRCLKGVKLDCDKECDKPYPDDCPYKDCDKKDDKKV